MAATSIAIAVAAATTASAAVTETVAVPLWLELLAVVASSISGVLAAREHHLDFLGAIGLAVACGLGGGLIRDVILQKGDVYILNQPLALPISMATATAAFIFPHAVEKPERLIAFLDIFAVGLFAAMGADKAMVYELEPTVCVMMGFFTAVGGGMLRDIIANRTPAIFQSSNFYAITSIAGSAVYVALVEGAITSKIIAMVACVTTTMLLRWISLRFNIQTPTEVDLNKVSAPIKRIGTKAVKKVAEHHHHDARDAASGKRLIRK